MARLPLYEAGRDIPWTVDKRTITAIEGCIRWAEFEAPSQLRFWMNELCFYMALVNQGYARKMSLGPFDPGETMTGAAWRIPVRRISNNYYLGWKVRNRGPAHWELRNESREGYFIEFGINWAGEGRRVRRPIRKMSLRKTMEFMMSTQAYHRVWVSIFSNPKHRHRGQGFTQIVQGPGTRGMGHMELGRRLPG